MLLTTTFLSKTLRVFVSALADTRRFTQPANFLTLALLVALFAASASATRYRWVDAQAASVNSSSWLLTDNGVSYAAVLKGSPQIPWISPSQAFMGTNSLGFRINPTTATPGQTDKITYPLVLGNLSFAPTVDGTSEYWTGFAVKFPNPNDFRSPTGKLLIFQWWQGSPYGPPLRMAITGADSNYVYYRFYVLNNDTLGNPSAVSIDIGGGSVSYGSWEEFTVFTRFDHTGNGEVLVKNYGSDILKWEGKLGYNPATKPYRNATASTPFPNPRIQIEFGLYREAQPLKHMYFIDEIKYADTWEEAAPSIP